MARETLRARLSVVPGRMYPKALNRREPQLRALL